MQTLEIELLQLQATLLQHLERRVAPPRRYQPAARHQQIELREVTAAEMAGEVALADSSRRLSTLRMTIDGIVQIGDRATRMH